MKPTKLLYLTDSYQKTIKATITNVTVSGTKTIILLDQTIFYPQGGGQPSDMGTIQSDTGTLTITSVKYNDGVVEHGGKLEGTLSLGQPVTLTLDWEVRYLHMQQHTAGHLIDEAVKSLKPEFHGVRGVHGINNEYFIEFNGFIDNSLKGDLETKITDLITADAPIITEMVTPEDIEHRHIFIPFTLPKNKPLRLITIGDGNPNPDGGTQLSHTGEVWPISLTDFSYADGLTQIHYAVTPPTKKIIESKMQNPNQDSITLDQFINELSNAKNLPFKETAKRILKLAPSDRKAGGQLLNELKKEIETKQSNNPAIQLSNENWLDVTMPGIKPPFGHLHPISQAIAEITHIFETIGFTRVRYPEVDWDKYAFENLNMPLSHPAADEWETFFIDTPPNKTMGKMLLTPHTSNGQTREMERVKTPPIRMLNIAKCYRRQQDVTHTAMFHQFEGLVIDKDINIQHLKGVLDYFAKEFYGPKANSRIRPFHFQFTEPSFEVDFSCVHCEGKGCRFCKSGWHEVGGAGMVHPNVLKAGGIDPKNYSGFAFGWGIERVYTLKPGLQLDDIRPLYSNNLDFLSNF